MGRWADGRMAKRMSTGSWIVEATVICETIAGQ
jgi:hypothetical protein